MSENIRTSALMRASFLAAAKVGQIFENGTTALALNAFDRLPAEGPWPRAQRYLEQLRAAELAETLPPIAETGT